MIFKNIGDYLPPYVFEIGNAFKDSFGNSYTVSEIFLGKIEELPNSPDRLLEPFLDTWIRFYGSEDIPTDQVMFVPARHHPQPDGGYVYFTWRSYITTEKPFSNSSLEAGAVIEEPSCHCDFNKVMRDGHYPSCDWQQWKLKSGSV